MRRSRHQRFALVHRIDDVQRGQPGMRDLALVQALGDDADDPSAGGARGIARTGLAALHVVDSMHERKALMARLSDAFLALPGGFGTLEEFCEAVTWTQLGIHDKPCGLLNVAGYFDPLIAMFDRCVADGFVAPETRAIVRTATTADAIIEALIAPLTVPVRPRLSEEQM